MVKCLAAGACGGDVNYHSWIGGTNYSYGLEEKFHCGNGGWGGGGSVMCWSIGYLNSIN